MSGRLYLSFIILLGFDTLGQVGFKLTGDAASPLTFDLPWLWRVLTAPTLAMIAVGYIGALVLYMGIIRRAAVGPVFAATHLDVVSVLLVSVLFFGESLTLVQVFGSVIILAGVVLLGLTEKENAPA